MSGLRRFAVSYRAPSPPSISTTSKEYPMFDEATRAAVAAMAARMRVDPAAYRQRIACQ